jgi:hypothetical protein
MALSPDVQVAIVDLRKYRVLCYVRAGRETEIVPILSRFWQKCRFYRSFSSIMEITIFPLSSSGLPPILALPTCALQASVPGGILTLFP